MVDDLVEKLGDPATRAAIGAPGLTFKHWAKHENAPSAVAQRAIWLTWCLFFHPERLGSFESLVTWGKLSARPEVDLVPEDWSGWEI